MTTIRVENQLLVSIFFIVTLLSCKAQNESRATPNSTGEKVTVPFLSASPDDQIAEYIRNIMEDKYGNLWMGTNGYGVARYDGDSLQYFNPTNGLGGAQVTDVMQANDGRIWITTNGGVSVYDGKSFTNYTKADGLPCEWMWSVYEDSKGQIWAGGVEGLAKWNGDQFEEVIIVENDEYYRDERFKAQWVRDLLEIDGELWIATAKLGICIYNGKKFRYLTEEDGLCDNDISHIMRDSNGNIWIGTRYGGVCRYDGKSFKTFDTANGIGDDESIIIHEDSKGNIWFSSEGYGLYKYDGNKLHNYFTDQGLKVKAVQTIFEDSKGRFWTGGGGGLYRLYGDTFVNVTKDGPWEK